MELLNHIELEYCQSIEFIDEFTMIATDEDEGLFKFTRANAESLDWTMDNQIKVKRPTIVRCIDSNLYVISDNKELYWLDKDLKNK